MCWPAVGLGQNSQALLPGRSGWATSTAAWGPLAILVHLVFLAVYTEFLSMLVDIFKAAGLGIVEGLTEYIPVSSTGHLLLLQHFFGFGDDDFGNTFAVLIQLGAILALLSIYFARLWNIAVGMLSDAKARRFVLGVLVAFLPAAVIGALLHGFIKGVLFNPWIVCFSLIAGGAVLLYVDSLDLRPRYRDATAFSLPVYLAIATMAGAFAFDLYKNGAHMSADNIVVVAIGFIASFIAGWFVVKGFLDYVSGHGFDLFAWWRVIVGALGLIGLALVG